MFQRSLGRSHATNPGAVAAGGPAGRYIGQAGLWFTGQHEHLLGPSGSAQGGSALLASMLSQVKQLCTCFPHAGWLLQRPQVAEPAQGWGSFPSGCLSHQSASECTVKPWRAQKRGVSPQGQTMKPSVPASLLRAKEGQGLPVQGSRLPASASVTQQPCTHCTWRRQHCSSRPCTQPMELLPCQLGAVFGICLAELDKDTQGSEPHQTDSDMRSYPSTCVEACSGALPGTPTWLCHPWLQGFSGQLRTAARRRPSYLDQVSFLLVHALLSPPTVTELYQSCIRCSRISPGINVRLKRRCWAFVLTL
ncbi:uncharacterized protein LOC112551241 [Alligator sinensis]|uniref:Uncharacterized protein LOC112551241 n=1 Tax=Alligator sinensis TaxID=38654 RepID=A0A3Q0H8Y6_ALLSI|nr:uncharacterized protein LOC112551241 [Alligator sinensis]